MLVRRGSALLVLCLLVAGCGGSEDTGYSPRQVQEALRAQGLETELAFATLEREGQRVGDLLHLFSGTDFAGVEDYAVESPLDWTRRDWPGFHVWILDSEQTAIRWSNPRPVWAAPWRSPKTGMAHIRKGNVVAVTRPNREPAVRRALDALTPE